MSNFKDAPTFSTHDDYYTPKYAWEQIRDIINKDYQEIHGDKESLKVFECFSYQSNEQSIRNLSELGYNVIGNKSVDYLDNNTWTKDMVEGNYDIVLSNPPYQRIKSYKDRHNNLKYKCIKKLVDSDKPFVLLMNSTNMFQKWFIDIINGKDIKFIFPTKKINYDKYDKGGVNKVISKKAYLNSLNKKVKELTPEEKIIYDSKEDLKSASFNSIYVCYKTITVNRWI